MSENNHASVEAKVIDIVVKSRPSSDKTSITPATKFKEDLKADSLEVYEIIYTIEQELGVTINESEANDVETVADLIKLIQSRPGK